jgi:hypothetical protein
MVLFQYGYTRRVKIGAPTMEMVSSDAERPPEGAPSAADQAVHHEPVSGLWRQPQCRG